jgi:hypothetical protein
VLTFLPLKKKTEKRRTLSEKWSIERKNRKRKMDREKQTQLIFPHIMGHLKCPPLNYHVSIVQDGVQAERVICGWGPQALVNTHSHGYGLSISSHVSTWSPTLSLFPAPIPIGFRWPCMYSGRPNCWLGYIPVWVALPPLSVTYQHPSSLVADHLHYQRASFHSAVCDVLLMRLTGA